MKEIQECGADHCGENGEYHTVVYGGPIFKSPVHLQYGEEYVKI
ncbi:hypothetical protein KQI86_07030 [Clostridium sp. MSJ-11]|uniref:Diphthamide synthase domain-containing protein n=1 Tax=Clostridium mobile TaxID=2841512 RepID=A0ABS6EFW6_9CLOT|nr:hypothetical protein [Clostridium mobile]